MAYRNFRNEPYYEAPEVDLFPKTLALVQTYAQHKLAQQRQDKALAANWQADQQSSKFNIDAQEFGKLPLPILHIHVEWDAEKFDTFCLSCSPSIHLIGSNSL